MKTFCQTENMKRLFILINAVGALQFMSPENEVHETMMLQKLGTLAFESQFE